MCSAQPHRLLMRQIQKITGNKIHSHEGLVNKDGKCDGYIQTVIKLLKVYWFVKYNVHMTALLSLKLDFLCLCGVSVWNTACKNTQILQYQRLTHCTCRWSHTMICYPPQTHSLKQCLPIAFIHCYSLLSSRLTALLSHQFWMSDCNLFLYMFLNIHWAWHSTTEPSPLANAPNIVVSTDFFFSL